MDLTTRLFLAISGGLAFWVLLALVDVCFYLVWRATDLRFELKVSAFTAVVFVLILGTLVTLHVFGFEVPEGNYLYVFIVVLTMLAAVWYRRRVRQPTV